MKNIKQILIYFLYIILFWYFPIFSSYANLVFEFLQNLLDSSNLKVNSLFVYIFLFIPLIDYVIYFVFYKNTNKLLFLCLFFIAPFLFLSVFFLHGLTMIAQKGFGW